jgi:hypothetical protein
MQREKLEFGSYLWSMRFAAGTLREMASLHRRRTEKTKTLLLAAERLDSYVDERRATRHRVRAASYQKEKQSKTDSKQQR